MDFPLFDFILASLLMGLGIGFDVAIATMTRAQQLTHFRLAFVWIIGVSFTHTLFPMIGYLMAYLSVQILPAITPVIGVLAFACIFMYLKGELQQLAHPDNESNSSQLLVTIGLILAVSWDALWSGPAKSAQVIGWPELLVWTSFLLVGVMVAILAILSLKFARLVQNIDQQRHTVTWIGSWVQYSVIGYFGLLALFRYTFNLELFWWQILLIAFVLIALCMSMSLYLSTNKVIFSRQA